MTTPEAAATRLAQALQRAWDTLTAAQAKVLDAITGDLPHLQAVAAATGFENAIRGFHAAATAAGADFAETHVAARYQQGMRDAARALGAEATGARRAGIAAAASTRSALDERVRETTRRAMVFHRAAAPILREPRATVTATMSRRRQAQERGAALSAAHPLDRVVYRDDSRHAVTSWAHATAMAHSVTAYNTGYLTTARSEGVTYVEVRDGLDCGWLRHDDTDKANGTVRSLDEALEAAISHPRCARSFDVRPDILNDSQAKGWRPEPSEPPVPVDERYAAWGERGAAITAASTLPTVAQATALFRTGADEHTVGRFLASAVTADGLTLRAVIDTVDVFSDESFILRGDFLTASGERAGAWTFDLNPVARSAYLDYLKIESAHRAQGFASAWTEHIENWLIAQDYETISLLANIDVGGYSWARNGYFWTDERAAVDLLDELHEARDTAPAVVRVEIDRLLVRADRVPYGDAGYPSPWDLSELGAAHPWIDEEDRHMWFGKTFLLGRDWYGTKWLVAP